MRNWNPSYRRYTVEEIGHLLCTQRANLTGIAEVTNTGTTSALEPLQRERIAYMLIANTNRIEHAGMTLDLDDE
jgi:hypothetical protein